MESITLPVSGMTCGGCVGSVKRVLAALPGVGALTVSLESGSATVSYDASQVQPVQMQAAIQAAGFDCEL